MLDFRIDTFITLCKYKNYTKTAEILCITQPAVTQHIKFLEKKYNAKLFDYESKRLTLTKAGEMLLKAATTIKADQQKLKFDMSHIKNKNKKYVFGATLTIGEYILPSRIHNYLLSNPNTNIVLQVENTSTLINMLNTGQIDFAFVEGYFNKNDFNYSLVSKEKFIPVCGNNYLLENIYHLEDLVNHPLVLREFGSGTRAIFERVLKEHNLSLTEFPRIIEIGSTSTIKQLLINNAGVSFMYEVSAKEEIKNRLLKKIDLIDFNIEREFNFICLKDSIYYEDYYNFCKELFK